MAVNKVVYDGNVLIDLTETTVSPGTLMQGATALDASGNLIEGTATGGSVALDTTLSKAGMAADAKAVGDALDGKQDKMSDIETIAMLLDNDLLPTIHDGSSKILVGANNTIMLRY